MQDPTEELSVIKGGKRFAKISVRGRKILSASIFLPTVSGTQDEKEAPGRGPQHMWLLKEA